jgi:hypothetical protein
MNKTLLHLAVLILVVIAVSRTTASTSSQETPDCGRAVDGVQMCLASSGSSLRLAFSNVGDRDVTLNLGIMLANGKVQLPTNIAMKFTDAQGKTRLFKFADKRYGFVAGRVDDYVLTLRAGSTYSLQLKLDQFWGRETKEFSIPLLAGNNYLTAQFEGTGADAVNLDMPGVKLMNFWLGKVESNILTLRAN